MVPHALAARCWEGHVSPEDATRSRAPGQAWPWTETPRHDPRRLHQPNAGPPAGPWRLVAQTGGRLETDGACVGMGSYVLDHGWSMRSLRGTISVFDERGRGRSG